MAIFILLHSERLALCFVPKHRLPPAPKKEPPHSGKHRRIHHAEIIGYKKGLKAKAPKGECTAGKGGRIKHDLKHKQTFIQAAAIVEHNKRIEQKDCNEEQRCDRPAEYAVT